MDVLYVGSDKYDTDTMCPGSIVCLAIAEQISDDMISVQNCDVLRNTDDITLPDWLNGTPIFINEEEGVPYRGRDAVNQMKRLLSLSQKSNASQNRHAEMKKSGMGQPEMRQSTGMGQQDMRHGMDQQGMGQQGMGQQGMGQQGMHQQGKGQTDSLHDDFTMDVVVQEEEPRSGKITEHDLQKYMELRNNSPASAQPPQNTTSSQ